MTAGNHELNSTAQNSLSELEDARELLQQGFQDGIIPKAFCNEMMQHLTSAQATTNQSCTQYRAMLELGKSHAGHLKPALAEVDVLGRDSPHDEHDAATID